MLEKHGASLENVARNVGEGMRSRDDRMRFNWTKLGAQLYGVLPARQEQEARDENSLEEIFGNLDVDSRYPINSAVGFGDKPIARHG